MLLYMGNITGIVSQVYYGVPRFFAELFRATRAGAIILLAGFIGFHFSSRSSWP